LPPNLTRLLILEIDDSPEIHRILLSKLLASASPKFLSLKGKKIMTVKYSIVERGNPQDQAAPKKFYPSLQSSGRKTLRELSKRITQMCTVSSPDTLAVIESMLVVIPEELAAGNIVELGDFGSFWLRVKRGNKCPQKRGLKCPLFRGENVHRDSLTLVFERPDRKWWVRRAIV
jgi:hypothetical protein